MANLKRIAELPVAESADGLNLIVNDNGSAKQIAASALGTASASGMQSDWNQNDSTANDYIKNRPFYEESGAVLFDGDTKFAFDYMGPGDSKAYIPISKPLVSGKEYSVTIDGETVNCVATTRYDGHIQLNNMEFSFSTVYIDSTNPYTHITASAYVNYQDKDCYLRIAETNAIYKIDEKYLPDSVMNRNPYVIDSEAYTYGDDALAAILEGKQILVKVPNKNGNTIFSNFMPVLQYQLPNSNNNYLVLFYLKDGIAENIMTAMQTGSFDGVYGVIEMMLSETYTECPLKVSLIN